MADEQATGSKPDSPGSNIRLVVGLGNPGPRYARTRHNLGFMVLDELAGRSGTGFRKDGQSESASFGNVQLVKPQTFMNLSGAAVLAQLTKRGIRREEILVVHDDLDLELGRLRFRLGGSSGGQRGVQDIMNRLGKEFWRLKLGISGTPAGWETANWVLSRFREDEAALLAEVVSSAADAVQHALSHGPESAANTFNGLRLSQAG